jgi:hypothetical protein
VQTSEQFDAIAAALAKAQGVMDAASKDAANPHFKARFASLASVREAIRKPLSENGIAYIQTLRTNEGRRHASRSAGAGNPAGRRLGIQLWSPLCAHGDCRACG